MSIGIFICKRGGKKLPVEKSDWARSWNGGYSHLSAVPGTGRRVGLRIVEAILYPGLDQTKIIEKPNKRFLTLSPWRMANIMPDPRGLSKDVLQFCLLRECSKLKMQSVSPSTFPDPFSTAPVHFPTTDTRRGTQEIDKPNPVGLDYWLL